MKIFIALLFIGAALWAEDKPAPKPPVITDAAQSSYWRARALASEAKAEQSAVEANMALTCGADYLPQIDATGKISCTPKPSDPKK